MTERVSLFLEPLDVLQFRDHRPFDAGLDTVAESVFPMPSVFYGFLRSALVAERCPDFSTDGDSFRVPPPWASVLGGPARVGTLAMRGPVFARATATGPMVPLFSPPRDLVRTERGEWRVLGFRDWPFDDAPRVYRHDGDRLIDEKSAVPWSDEPATKDPPKILLTPDGAREYFQATGTLVLQHGVHTLREDDVFVMEDRVGIALDPSTRTTAEGMFYVTRPFRLTEGHGFAVDVEISASEVRDGLMALDGRTFRLGGKGHRARVRVQEGPMLPDDLDVSGAPGNKRWLLSPLPIGAATAGIDMVTDRAVLVGGYDFVKRAPKPLRRALPRGTVIRLRTGGTLGELFASDEDRKMGYGTALGGPSARSDA